MFTYWMLFLIPAFAALTHQGRTRILVAGNIRFAPAWLAFGLLLTAIIGLRQRVGGDWFNYLGHLQYATYTPLGELLVDSDPGYKLLNYLSAQMDWGIYGVNTIAALVFSFGLIAFCRNLPRPWLAMTAAIPYLVIVVAMGYTRQGIALGFAMLGLLALERKSVRQFAFWILLGATFHRSAILLLPVAALASTKNRIWIAFWVAVLAVVGYLALLERDAENLYTNYIERGYQSQGAMIRLMMNAAAAGLFLALQRRMELTEASLVLWRWISIISILLLAAYFAAPGISTALDRLGLYLLPLQLVVFARLPSALGKSQGRKLWILLVVGYYAFIQYVWLNYAGNAYAWRPYTFYPFDTVY